MLHRLRFIPGRILQAIPVALGVSILVFLMSHLLPGNPAVAILGNHATPATWPRSRSTSGSTSPCGTSTGCSSRTCSRVTWASR